MTTIFAWTSKKLTAIYSCILYTAYYTAGASQFFVSLKSVTLIFKVQPVVYTLVSTFGVLVLLCSNVLYQIQLKELKLSNIQFCQNGHTFSICSQKLVICFPIAHRNTDFCRKGFLANKLLYCFFSLKDFLH